MILFCGSLTNCPPQSLHLWFCLPLWKQPFLICYSEAQLEQQGFLAVILYANNQFYPYLLGTT